jgi:hypothetical protein
MNPTALDPLAVRVARRHLAAVRTSKEASVDLAVSTERLAREYQRRGDALVPVDGEEEEHGEVVGRRTL